MVYATWSICEWGDSRCSIPHVPNTYSISNPHSLLSSPCYPVPIPSTHFPLPINLPTPSPFAPHLIKQINRIPLIQYTLKPLHRPLLTRLICTLPPLHLQPLHLHRHPNHRLLRILAHPTAPTDIRLASLVPQAHELCPLFPEPVLDVAASFRLAFVLLPARMDSTENAPISVAVEGSRGGTLRAAERPENLHRPHGLPPFQLAPVQVIDLSPATPKEQQRLRQLPPRRNLRRPLLDESSERRDPRPGSNHHYWRCLGVRREMERRVGLADGDGESIPWGESGQIGGRHAGENRRGVGERWRGEEGVCQCCAGGVGER